MVLVPANPAALLSVLPSENVKYAPLARLTDPARVGLVLNTKLAQWHLGL